MNERFKKYSRRILAFSLSVLMMLSAATPTLAMIFAFVSTESGAAQTDVILNSSGERYSVRVTCGFESGIPEKAELLTEEIHPDTAPYDLYAEAMRSTLGEEERIVFLRLFSISILNDGEKVQPDAPVEVEIECEELSGNDAVTVVHFPDRRTAEEQTEIVEAQRSAFGVKAGLLAAPMRTAFQETEAEAAEDAIADMETLETVSHFGVVVFETDGFSVFGVMEKETISARILTSGGAAYRVDVSYGADAEIPAGAELRAEEILPGTDEYKDYMESAAEAIGLDDPDSITFARFFDIEIRADGNKIEPAAQVEVTIVCENAPEEDGEDADTVRIVHFADDGVELIDTEREADGVHSFRQGSFSVSGVVYWRPQGGEEKNILTGKAHVMLSKGGESYTLQKDFTLLPDDSFHNEDAYVWTVETDKGGLYIQNGSGQYLNITESGPVLTAERTSLSIEESTLSAGEPRRYLIIDGSGTASSASVNPAGGEKTVTALVSIRDEMNEFRTPRHSEDLYITVVTADGARYTLEQETLNLNDIRYGENTEWRCELVDGAENQWYFINKKGQYLTITENGAALSDIPAPLTLSNTNNGTLATAGGHPLYLSVSGNSGAVMMRGAEESDGNTRVTFTSRAYLWNLMEDVPEGYAYVELEKDNRFYVLNPDLTLVPKDSDGAKPWYIQKNNRFIYLLTEENGAYLDLRSLRLESSGQVTPETERNYRLLVLEDTLACFVNGTFLVVDDGSSPPAVVTASSNPAGKSQTHVGFTEPRLVSDLSRLPESGKWVITLDAENRRYVVSPDGSGGVMLLESDAKEERFFRLESQNDAGAFLWDVERDGNTLYVGFNGKYLNLSGTAPVLTDEKTALFITDETLASAASDGPLYLRSADGQPVLAGSNPEGEGHTVVGFAKTQYVRYKVGEYEGPKNIGESYKDVSFFEKIGGAIQRHEQWWKDQGPSLMGIDGYCEALIPDERGLYTLRDVSTEYREAYFWGDVRFGVDVQYYQFMYSFAGWKIEGGDGTLFQPGDKIPVPNDGTDLTLRAVWRAHFTDPNIAYDKISTWDDATNTVAFYVVIDGTTGEFTPKNKHSYTGAVYTTSIIDISPNIQAFLDCYYWNDNPRVKPVGFTKVFIGNDRARFETPEEFRSATTRIKSLADGAYGDFTGSSYLDGKYSSEYPYFKLLEFPSDDEILLRIKNDLQRTGEKIEVDGITYTNDDINTDNFAVYWYMFSMHESDGWHIDGVIRRKEGSLTVKKEFIGDQELIDQILNGYSIHVTQKRPDNTVYKSQTLTTGTYTHKEGNTYTWVLNGFIPDIGGKYPITVTESGEAVPAEYADEYSLTRKWELLNKGKNNLNDQGTGDGSTDPFVSVCYSYEKGVDYNAYQTVKFTNIYRKPYELTVIKRDAESGSGMAGMTFDLELKNSSGDTIVDLAGDTAVDGSLVFKLDAVGRQPGEFYSFKLTEKPAEGYKTPLIVEGRLLAAEGNLRIEPDSLTASCDGESTSVEAEASSSILYVKNQSKNTVSLKVVKEWIGDQRDQVTVRLLRNGSPILTDVVLKADEDTEKNWSYTWTDLPEYVDGKKAEYSVREMWIGNPTDPGSTYYTPDDDPNDGFLDYKVTITKEETEDSVFIVKVVNEADQGQYAFTKVNEKTGALLKGAEFTVYTDPACTNIALLINTDTPAVFKSDDSGKVLLEKLKVRTAPYYVKETKAPEGYTAQNTVWVLTVRKANSTMKVYGGGNTPVDTVGNETIRIRKLSRGIQPEEVVGAELALYKLGSANPIEQWRTGAEPHILSRWLEDGKYILKELVVPEGYLIPEEDVMFEVKNGIPLTTDILTYDSTIGEYTIVVYNTSSISLPATGSPGSKGVRIAGGVLLAMCAMGCAVIRKKREE